MKSFRLGAVYGAPPLFNPDINEMGYFEPSDLGISAALLAEIDDWNRAFQRTFCDAYPPDGGFQAISDRENHNLIGQALSVKLQEELGGLASVVFIPLK
ncbi:MULTISPECIES: hypothetical protein [unclassified Dyella]|uniref:hypothetical protein n=1 Tax=unclassified Dyella TaxID=2634549 RepID=UPI003F90ED93